MTEENVLFEKIETFRKTLLAELANAKTNFKQPLDKQEQLRGLHRWVNLLRSKFLLLHIQGKIGDQEFSPQDSSNETSQTAAVLKNLAETIGMKQVEENKLKLAALSSVISTIIKHKREQHRKLIDLLHKKHELELEVEELSEQYSRVLEKLIETKKEIIKEIHDFKNEINTNGQRLSEMKEKQPSTVMALQLKTQQYISKINAVHNFILTIIIAGEVSLIENRELLDLLIKQRNVITLDNIKNFCHED